MKRPQVALITKDANGTETQHDIYKTMKEAEVAAREMAMARFRETGLQTEYHSKQIYYFEDGFNIICRKIRDELTIQYTQDLGCNKAGEIRKVSKEIADSLIADGYAIEIPA